MSPTRHRLAARRGARPMLVLAFAVTGATLTTAQTARVDTVLAIAHVTVVDVDGEGARPDHTVVVEGDRITAVGPSDRVRVPSNARLLDGRGKFLIPGLWDMHVHGFWSPAITATFAPLFVANGVTGVRDMGSPLPVDQQLAWQREIATGRRLGPRVVLAGKIVDGPSPIWPGSIAVADPAQGRAAVRSLQRDGVGFVKVYELLPRLAFFAIADEARRLDLPFEGHVPSSVSALEAAEAGQRSIEHLSGLLAAASLRGDEPRTDSRPWGPEVKALLDSYDATRAARVFARLQQLGTWQSPTLITIATVLGDLARGGGREGPNEKYLPRSEREEWRRMADAMTVTLTEEDREVLRRYVTLHLTLAGEAARAGVPILAGSDVPKPHLVPGFSLHDELALLVDAGLSPREALRAATSNPARFIGREHELGTVAVGKLADLVVLDADPLASIRNTRRVHAVVLGGRLLDRVALDRVLREVEADAGSR
ncbi:MAG: amidohydrolase family protein [Gemmatimonadales bacterium]